MMCHRIGMPPISTIGFGLIAVSSPNRLPRPPAKTTVCIVAPRLGLDSMTDPTPTARKSSWRVLTGPAGLCLLILMAAALLRIDGVGFGLPALNDPDEPLFMSTALEMLAGPTLNPGWFGHPGTITFYSLMLVMALVGGLGVLTGRFADFDAFAAAVYADPGVLFLPARLLMVAFGVTCVWMTWRLGKRLGGERLGLVAAAILAVNAVHIEYSQIIRTDMQASLFMLLCALSALAIARDGRRRDYLLAGIFAGLACATKWPAAVIGVTGRWAPASIDGGSVRRRGASWCCSASRRWRPCSSCRPSC